MNNIKFDDGYISIHAPTRGATLSSDSSLIPKVISIHAPTRGATKDRGFKWDGKAFQSTLPQGERRETEVVSPLSTIFQSTLPQGERRTRSSKQKIMVTEFQSTLPQGERPNMTRKNAPNRLISIHAPTRGATGIKRLFKPSMIFQSTLPQGERQQFYTKFHICFISFLPILSPYHISTHSPLPTFNHFLYIFSGANRPEISCLLPFRTKTISGIL